MFRKPSEISSSSEDEIDPSSGPPSAPPASPCQPTAGAPEQEPEPVNPVTLYSSISPTTPANHHSAILFNSLLEHFVKTRVSALQPGLADRIFANLAHRLGNLGFVPQTSGDIAREDLAPVRQGYLRGLDHLLSQEIDKNTEENRAAGVLAGDSGRRRGVESGMGAGARPSFRRLLTDLTTQNLNPNERQAIHRSSSLSVLSDAYKNSPYRPSTAPGAASGTATPPFLPPHAQSSPAIIQPAILLPPPRYVNDFVEIALLGKGGYGSVYHVRHRLDGVEYAIKKVVIKKGVLENELGGKKDGLERVMNEIKTLAQLHHAGIVRYFCSWVEGVVEDMLTTPQFIGDHAGVQDVQDPQSPKAEIPNEIEDIDADIVFAYSGEDERIETVEETVTTYGASGQASDGLEDSIESIPRPYTKRRHSQSNVQHGKPKVAFDIPSHSDSESELTGSNIFSSGGGLLIKSTANSHGRKSSSTSSGLTLYIQMSLHSFTLTSFLSTSVHLSKPIPRHCFCVKSSLDIFLGLLEGVQYLHSQGIAHRDLKPGNIFLDIEPSRKGCRCGEAVVLPHIGDFGLGTSISNDGHDSTAAVGTEFYKPVDLDPAIQGDVVGRDLFALGIILLELLVRFGTRMERVEVLSRISKNGQIPKDIEKLEDHRVARVIKGCCGVGENRWEISKVKASIQIILDDLKGVKHGGPTVV
ncbi:kinase-like protein [Tuber magnatum]|uniref:non-specific serine/threonine protein kinase n=1 Tax=Tuber magnatum TaxID=42249 RepID=A0A317STH3_9PEZI|nr:kinase-like protein [Tuber magnatum]